MILIVQFTETNTEISHRFIFSRGILETENTCSCLYLTSELHGSSSLLHSVSGHCWHDIMMLWLVLFSQYWVVLCGVMHQTLKVTAYHSLHLLYNWFHRHLLLSFSFTLLCLVNKKSHHHSQSLVLKFWYGCPLHDLCCCCKWFTPGRDAVSL